MALGKGIPVINGFDLNSKLPLDSRAVADTLEEMNALVTNGSVGDGQLCYCKADKKLYVLKDNVWSEVGGGGGIPVVEGTANEETMEITIPEAQTRNFILHAAGLGYIYINYIFGAFYSSVCAGTPFDPKGAFLVVGRGTSLKIVNGNLVAKYDIKDANNVPAISDKIFIAIYNNEPLLFSEIKTQVYNSQLYVDETSNLLYYYVIANSKLTKKFYISPSTNTITFED